VVVLHVVAPGPIGGLERVVQLLTHQQARAGEEVHVAAVLDRATPDNPLLADLEAGGVTVHPIVLPGRAYWRERVAIRDLAGRLRPAIVHTHGYRPDIVDAGVARRLGIPTVTTVHGFAGGDWKNRLYERLQARAFRRFDAVVAVSRPVAARLIRERVPPERVHVVQNAWQETALPLDRARARRALGLPDAGFVVGWAGRLSAEKGPDVLLEALVHLRDLSIEASVLGSGREQPSLQARARQLGVERYVRWHGIVPDAGRQFAAFDVFVLSSRTEGTPMVLLEAMAAGVPIVATCVGGVPDMLAPAEALLVPADDPVTLAAAVRAVREDPEAAAARARAGRARLEREFRVEPWVARYRLVYERAESVARRAG
jgi:glycosyltransferase involved in cell wall biosynthesis